MKALTHGIATFFWVGHLRPAPGTWGSLAALPVAYAIAVVSGFPGLLIASIAVFFIGLWATREETRGAADHDPSEIVIDEVVGQWIALFPAVYGASMMGIELWKLYPGWIGAFVFFRLFDIWKPWLVGWADRRGDAMGVMLDDVIAGVFAAIATTILAAIFHGLLV